MTDPDPTPPTAPARPKRMNVAVLLICAAVLVTLPLLAFAGIYLLLDQTSFESVDELKADELESVRLHMLNLTRGRQNRPDPVDGDDVRADENTPHHHDKDIDPVMLTRPDFGVILQPLRDAERMEAKDWPAVVLVGDIRVRFKDGRPGTIKLYRYPDNPASPHSPERIYFKVKSNLYRACTLKELRSFAEPCASRGTKAGR